MFLQLEQLMNISHCVYVHCVSQTVTSAAGNMDTTGHENVNVPVFIKSVNIKLCMMVAVFGCISDQVCLSFIHLW